jgi:hypothetical protein
MIVVTHFSVPESDGESFAASATDALAAFGACAGYERGWLGRAAEDPTAWVMGTEWQGVGSYRRALSTRDVRMAGTALLSRAVDMPSAFELLYADSDEYSMTATSGRSPEDQAR